MHWEKRAFPSSVLARSPTEGAHCCPSNAAYKEKRSPLSAFKFRRDAPAAAATESLTLAHQPCGSAYLPQLLPENRPAGLGGQLLKASQKPRQPWGTRLSANAEVLSLAKLEWVGRNSQHGKRHCTSSRQGFEAFSIANAPHHHLTQPNNACSSAASFCICKGAMHADILEPGIADISSIFRMGACCIDKHATLSLCLAWLLRRH